jgi:hypothetical protein
MRENLCNNGIPLQLVNRAAMASLLKLAKITSMRAISCSIGVRPRRTIVGGSVISVRLHPPGCHIHLIVQGPARALCVSSLCERLSYNGYVQSFAFDKSQHFERYLLTTRALRSELSLLEKFPNGRLLHRATSAPPAILRLGNSRTIRFLSVAGTSTLVWNEATLGFFEKYSISIKDSAVFLIISASLALLWNYDGTRQTILSISCRQSSDLDEAPQFMDRLLATKVRRTFSELGIAVKFQDQVLMSTTDVDGGLSGVQLWDRLKKRLQGAFPCARIKVSQ